MIRNDAGVEDFEFLKFSSDFEYFIPFEDVSLEILFSFLDSHFIPKPTC